jgi:hypothetical protein
MDKWQFFLWGRFIIFVPFVFFEPARAPTNRPTPANQRIPIGTTAHNGQQRPTKPTSAQPAQLWTQANQHQPTAQL